MELTTRRVASLLVVAAFVASATLVAAAGKPKVWIDQPLPGDVLPLAPAAVTIHAASDVGTASVGFLVDGLPVAELAAPTGDLVTVAWLWQPPGLGTHLLTVVAHGMDGVPSDAVSVGVTFVDASDLPPTPPPLGESPGPSRDPGATPPPATSTPGATSGPNPTPTKPPKTQPPGPTPTPTRPPTPPPCQPQGPDLLEPEYDAAVGTGTPTFVWSDNNPPSCQPIEFHIQISESNQFDELVMADMVPGDENSWTAPEGLLTCVDYWWRVLPMGESGEFGEPSATFLFHIIGRECP